jgi:hypothetical protein
MKKIGEYTARGIVTEADTTEGNPQKISLFDGRFDTAYRVKGFYIWGATYNASAPPDVIGKLSKNDDGVTSNVNFFRADDDNQIAWAGNIGSADAFQVQEPGIVDPDNLIVEDLFVYVRCGSTSDVTAVNYLVIMEKYEITDWQGALAMARDRAQGDL